MKTEKYEIEISHNCIGCSFVQKKVRYKDKEGKQKLLVCQEIINHSIEKDIKFHDQCCKFTNDQVIFKRKKQWISCTIQNTKVGDVVRDSNKNQFKVMYIINSPTDTCVIQNANKVEWTKELKQLQKEI